MRRRLLTVSFCLASALAFATQAQAATLTIVDTFGGSNTVWTLDIATGCTTCAGTLTAQFQDPDGGGALTNAYTGAFIDSVQWLIGGSDPTAVNTLVGPTNATTTSWSAAVDASLNANQCSGGANDNVCAQSNTALGFGPIANGSTLTWTFSETFSSALPSTLTTGNIRGAFNNANGSNLNIFSPEGGTFTGTGTGTGTGTSTSSGTTLVPEPTSLLLFGSGLTMAAYRARRKKQNEKKS